MAAEHFAPAKINLTLRITGKREDGYHLLDSLVMFADVGDQVFVEPSDGMELIVTGPMAAGVPADQRNLVWKAAELMGVTARITLDKHLPAAAGIGGGSSDAAAALKALSDLSGQHIPAGTAARLGADVPVCLRAGQTWMRGIGDELECVEPKIPALNALLVNPGVAVSTAEVFSALVIDTGGPGAPADNVDRPEPMIASILAQGNDLQKPALEIAPVIGEVIHAIDACDDCTFARMSGSGATCFGVFPDAGAAQAAADRIGSAHPDWWVVATVLS